MLQDLGSLFSQNPFPPMLLCLLSCCSYSCRLLLRKSIFLCSFFFSFIPFQYFIFFLPLLIYLEKITTSFFLQSFNIILFVALLFLVLFNFVISKTLPQTSLCSISWFLVLSSFLFVLSLLVVLVVLETKYFQKLGVATKRCF